MAKKRKIGRNDKCPCGSGKKYKRCCLSRLQSIDLDSMMNSANMKLNIDSSVLKSKGIHIDFVRPVDFKGKRVWALGNRLYPNEPPSITFGEFILRVLQRELGEPWWDSNKKLSVEDQHYVFKAFNQFELWKKRPKKDLVHGPNGTTGAFPDGWTFNLLSLAFDISMIIHRAEKIPKDLINRLRNKNEFQGARYEIAVASIFARIGCEINFIDNKNNNERHPEFYAEIPSEKIKVAVEAKSRRRPGVIHESGEAEISNLRKTRVVPLINEALKQNPDNMPFVIFIDINQPHSLSQSPEEHVKRLVKATTNLKSPSSEKPDDFSLIYFTNYSGQFLQEEQMVKTYSTFVLPQFSKYPINNSSFLPKLQKAVNSYGYIPNLTPNGIYIE